MIKILLGGSPCTNWSIAQKNNRETEPSGMGWELFKNYLIAKEKFKPDYFLYENNKSAAQPIKNQISKELGVPLQYINSALVSAQNRQRFYAHNIPNVPLPADRGIMLRDVLGDDVQPIILHNIYGGFKETKPRIFTEKSPTIRTGRGGGHIPNALVNGYDINDITLINVTDRSRKLTVTECKRLQTIPDWYIMPCSKTQCYKMLGNGWTVEVIKHILSHIPNIKNEPIEVLSMYDGMSCGQITLRELGCNVVKYYATEIDKYAIQTTMANFPDTIQLGDAFQVREPEWGK